MLRRGLHLGVWLLLSAAAAILWRYDAREREALPGIVERVEHRVTSIEPARVAALHVQVGDVARAGQPLITLDVTDLDGALAVARARRAEIEAQLQAARAGAATARHQAEARRAEAHARLEAIRADVAGARAEREALAAHLEALEAAVAAGLTAHERLGRLRAQRARLGGSLKHTSRAREAYRAVLAALDAELEVPQPPAPLRAALGTQDREIEALEARRAGRVLRAPIDGVVTQIDGRLGDLAQPSAPVVILTAAESPWVTAYLSAPEVRGVAAGWPATITRLDGAAGRPAEVTWVGPAVIRLPERLWLNPQRPLFGRPARLRLETPGFLPGERVTVRLEPPPQ